MGRPPRRRPGPTAGVKLVVGLGNPGPRYARTRHNAGFRIAGHFAAQHGIPLDHEDFGGMFGRGEIAREQGGSVPVAVLLPLTFMNRSGESVAEAVASLPADLPHDLLLVSDDVDLPFGRLRIRASGGAGGHLGLADVIEWLGRRDFPRLRFGVGRPDGGYATSDYVLQAFSRDEERDLPELVARAAEAVHTVVTVGVAAAMNRFNAQQRPAPAPSEG